MLYATDTTIQEALPQISGLTSEQVSQIANDAAAIYKYLADDPWCDERALRQWGEVQGLPPERLNQALGLLTRLGKVVGLAGIVSPAPPDSSKPKRRARKKAKP